jgi:hypothetical protein
MNIEIPCKYRLKLLELTRGISFKIDALFCYGVFIGWQDAAYITDEAVQLAVSVSAVLILISQITENYFARCKTTCSRIGVLAASTFLSVLICVPVCNWVTVWPPMFDGNLATPGGLRPDLAQLLMVVSELCLLRILVITLYWMFAQRKKGR